MTGGEISLKPNRSNIFSVIVAVGLSLLLAMQFLIVDGSIPVKMNEYHNTIENANREWTNLVAQAERNETQILMTAAGSVMGIVVIYFIFGSPLIKSRFAVFFASSTLLTAGFSLWMGFRVINEIKWLIKFSIAANHWTLSRYDSFHMLQLVCLYLALLTLLPYLYLVLKERYAES